ncbi:ribosome hibernation-promoting factor, HPF/YfiA family [Stomatohabitans albus]|uniref:ribosome hibernation-promoting factor, HPF/YfiA family n=1 Tax=Stomatohabitans albus TaxID=3110766 RepID=UPI00300CC8FD
MDIAIRVRNGDIHAKLKEEAIERVNHATRIFDKLVSAEVMFDEENNPRIAKAATVEITSHARRHVIRGVGQAEDHRSALDIAIDKYERALRKYKERLVDARRKAADTTPPATTDLPPLKLGGALGLTPDEELVSRRKVFVLNRMSEEEAALQLDLLGHDFFLFLNPENGRPSVMYRRGEGDLGLIETLPEEA